MNLVVVTPPSEEPITLAEAKAQLRADGTEEDALISGYIVAARLKCEEIARRAFITQTLAYSIDQWPDGRVINIPRPPMVSVTSILYKDYTGTVHALTNYVIDTASEPGRVALVPGSSWPYVYLFPVGAITITFVAGYGAASAVPQIYKQAVQLLVAHWYGTRETAQDGAMEEIPFGVKDILLSDRGWY